MEIVLKVTWRNCSIKKADKQADNSCRRHADLSEKFRLFLSLQGTYIIIIALAYSKVTGNTHFTFLPQGIINGLRGCKTNLES
jgi:hypothetical protein